MVENYRAEDAEIAFVMIGAYSTKALEAVDRLRARGVAAGLVRPRLLRPFPVAALRQALLGRRALAVVDQNLSMGAGGVLAGEIASALYGCPGAPVIASYIGGLGGRDIGAAEFEAMAGEARAAADAGAAPAPRLLYTATELREVRKLQAIALAERREAGAAS
jgi:pyruvate ferredoxin oxidoreductase alpha subunit